MYLYVIATYYAIFFVKHDLFHSKGFVCILKCTKLISNWGFALDPTGDKGTTIGR